MYVENIHTDIIHTFHSLKHLGEGQYLRQSDGGDQQLRLLMGILKERIEKRHEHLKLTVSGAL